MTIIIDVKDSVADKILYFLESFQKDLKIIKKDDSPIVLEEISEDETDYNYIVQGRQKRLNGEKTYSLDEVIKEFE